MPAKHFLLVLVSLALIPLAAQAHRLNESYVYFNVADDSFAGRFEATYDDVNSVIPIDEDGDGEVSQEEFDAHAEEIFALFQERLTIAHEGTDYPIVFSRVTRLGTAEGAFGQLWFDVPGLTEVPDALTIGYRPLADVIPTGHAGFILIESNTRLGLEANESYVSLVFKEGTGPQRLSLVGEPADKLFVDFVRHGLWAVWRGFDHLFFFLTLLLPMVLRPYEGHWTPRLSFDKAFGSVVGLIAVFTVSVSVTLVAATLGFAQLPFTLVETVIAVSIITMAVLNFVPHWHNRVLWLVFAFGLFHGFGFANLLAPLGLAPTQLPVGLAGYIAGVSLGQIVVVLLTLPILWVLRNWRFYPPLGLKFGSLAMMALAGIWVVERTTGFNWNARATLAYLVGLVS